MLCIIVTIFCLTKYFYRKHPGLLRQRWPNQAFVVCTDFSHLYILLSFHHYDVWECDVAYVTVQKTRREKWWIEVGKNVNSLSCYTYVMCMYVHSENYRFHNLQFNRNWFCSDNKNLYVILFPIWDQFHFEIWMLNYRNIL